MKKASLFFQALKTTLAGGCLLAMHIAVAGITGEFEESYIQSGGERYKAQLLYQTNDQSVSRMPGVTLMGLLGSNTTGYADMMFPAFGYPESFVHFDPQVLVHDGDEYTLSLGGGFRQLTDTAGIWGAYVFGDYNQSANGNSFWFISPGIERLGDIVDFSANLYIPTDEDPQHAFTTTGQTLGVDHVLFSGHSQFDILYNTFESVGMGGDAEVGFRIPMMNNPKFYVGGYYFNPDDSSEGNIQGITARLEAPITDSLMVVVSDSYDSVDGNTIKAGIQFDIGARRNSRSFQGNLADRMVDPIHRNLVAIAGPSDTGQPIAETTTQTKVLTQDNIAFFDQRNTRPGDGTFENPFQQMNQDNVNSANTGGNNNLYVNSGPYNIGNNNIQLTNDNLYGRQDFNGHAFVLAAEGNNRPLFQFGSAAMSGFTLNGDNNLFDSVRLTGGAAGTPGSGVGIQMLGNPTQSATFSINNSDVNYFQNGLSASNFGTVRLNVTDSHFDGNGASGLSAQAVDNVTIIAQGSSFNGNAGGVGTAGILARSTAGSINITAQNTSANGNSDGINARTTNGNIVITTENSNFNENREVGVFALGRNVTINAQDSSFDSNRTGGLSAGSLSSANGIITITAQNSSFNNQTATTNGIGLSVSGANNAIVTILNSRFDGNGLTGFLANNVNTTINIVDSSFSGNRRNGLDVTASDSLTITANNSAFNGNGTSGIGSGLIATTTLNSANATININNSSFNGNRTSGLSLIRQGGAGTGVYNAIIQNSTINNNTGFGIFGQNTLGSTSNMIINYTGSTLAGNNSSGDQTNRNQASGANIDWRPP